MRLALLIYGSLDTLSGGYLYDRKMVAYLREHGDDVSLVSLPWRSYPRHLMDNFSTPLFEKLVRLKIDALIQDELNHPSVFWINQRLKKKVAYPLVSIVHHLRSSEFRPGWQNSLYRSVERRYLASIDGFIFNSQTTRRVVSGLLGEDPPGVVAYPAGDRLNPAISPEALRQRAYSSGPLRIFFLGNVIPRKGLHTLLQALRRLPKDTWQLAVTGSLEMDRGYAGRILRSAAEFGLDDNLRFTGPLEDSPLVEEFLTNQLLVVPSSYEGFGIAYLEGMGFGLPAIASTAGAAGEIVTHGVDGYLIAPGDAEALADHLRSLIQDRELLFRMSRAARERYLGHPTWEQTGERVRGYLSGLVG